LFQFSIWCTQDSLTWVVVVCRRTGIQMVMVLKNKYENIFQWFSTCILPEYLSAPLVFSGVCVARFLVLCVCFVDRCLSFCTFSFGHCLFFFDLRILTTPLVSSNSFKLMIAVLSHYFVNLQQVDRNYIQLELNAKRYWLLTAIIL
jgi:hypothetical protein